MLLCISCFTSYLLGQIQKMERIKECMYLKRMRIFYTSARIPSFIMSLNVQTVDIYFFFFILSVLVASCQKLLLNEIIF